MSHILISRPQWLSRQPANMVAVNRAGDGRYICNAFLPTHMPFGYSPLTGAPAIEHYAGIAAVKRVSPAGIYLSSDDLANDIAVAGPGCAPNSPFSIDVAIYFGGSPGVDTDIFIGETTSNDGSTVRARVKVDGNVELRINDYSNGNVERFLTTSTPLSIGQNTIRITLDAARTATIYVNGAIRAKQSAFITEYVAYYSVRLFHRAGPRGYYSALHNAECPLKVLGFVIYSIANPQQSIWHAFAAPSHRRLIASSATFAALAGNAQAIASASGAVSTAVPLVGAALGIVTATGALTTQMPLSGVAAAVAAVAGNLALGISISGQSLASAIAAGLLGTQFPLAGDAQAIAASTGTLELHLTLAGAAVAQANATGVLAVITDASLAGHAQAQAQATGLLTLDIPLSGPAQIVATATGNLGSGADLAGAAVSAAAAFGDLAITVTLSGPALAQSIAAGGLALQIPLIGAAIGHASALGSLSGMKILGDARYTVCPPRRDFTCCPAKRNFMVAQP